MSRTVAELIADYLINLAEKNLQKALDIRDKQRQKETDKLKN